MRSTRPGWFSLTTFSLTSSPARGVGVVSQFAANPGFEHLDFADPDGIDSEHIVTQQYHVGQFSRGDRSFFVLLKFGESRTHSVSLDRFLNGQLLLRNPPIRILPVERRTGCGRVQREHGIDRRDIPIRAQCDPNTVVKERAEGVGAARAFLSSAALSP